MENRKNTILLTVIAVATLLVAVVGATFAYFTAQGGTAASRPVTVTTHTTDSATFSIAKDLKIEADQTNFAEGKGDASDSTTATATFKANDTEAANFCYNVDLEVTTNNFVYSKANTTNAAELTFTAVKGGTTLVNAADITTGTATVHVPNTAGGTNYEHKISADAGQEITDNWSFTVTFVNLDLDQNDNTEKSFGGTIKFTKVTCVNP